MFVLLQNKIIPAAEAHVSVLDRGFLYGDGVFTTMRAYRGRLAHFPLHFARISDNLDALGIKVDWNEKKLLVQLVELLQKNNSSGFDSFVRVQVSRGGSEDLAAGGAAPMEPTVTAITWRVPDATLQKREKGVSLVTVPGLHSGGTARVKLSSYAKNLLCTRAAKEQKADDGVFVDGRGFVAEAANANLFFVKDGVLHTPSLDVGALPGITRGRIMELCRWESIEVLEGRYTAAEVAAADEVFLSSSVSEVVPVHHWNSAPVRNFEKCPLTRRVQALYHQDTQESLLPGK